jgi:DNA repair protein RecO (recombination protein O)
MPVRHCEAFVLRTYRVGEADKVVVFLTRELGKVRGFAKGARRPRSRFGASLEVGTEVALTFFEKEAQELISVDRCDIVRSDFSSLGDPLVACTLAYFTDLVDAFAPEREPNAKLYRLVKAAMASLVGGGEPDQIARYFEAWLLRLGGFYPRRKSCASCGRRLARRGARYHVEEHRLVCRHCSDAGGSLSPETLEFLQRIWNEPPQSLPPPVKTQVLGELAVLHQKLITQQLEKELRSYQVLQDLVRIERKR